LKNTIRLSALWRRAKGKSTDGPNCRPIPGVDPRTWVSEVYTGLREEQRQKFGEFVSENRQGKVLPGGN